MSLRIPLRILIAAVYTAGQVVLAGHAEANVWAERRRAKAPVQLAATPAGLLGDMPARPLLSNALAGSAVRPPTGRAAASSVMAALARSPVSLRGVPAAAPDIVLLQDVHLNPDAQRHIAQAVTSLHGAGALSAVGFEGAFGPMDAGALTARQNQGSVQRAARAYLEAGRLAAPSFAALEPALRGVPFVGVDDRARHAANVAAYLESRAGDAVLERELAEWRGRITAARTGLPPELRSMEEHRDAHRAGRMGLGDFVRRLSLAGPLPASLALFKEAYDLEAGLDFAQVERDRRAVLTRLAGALSEAEMRELLAASLACRSGETPFAVFYSRLEELCRSKRVRLESHPAFRSYVRYVLLSDRIDAAALMSDLEKHAHAVAMRLAASDAERHVVLAGERLGLMEKLRTFSLTPAEWESYERGGARALGGFDGLRGVAMGAHETFYREADARSDLMAGHIAALRRAHRGGAVAFVTGGFHSARMVEALSRSGLRVAVATPRLNKVDLASGSAYLTAFAREKTPLDRLFAGEKLFVAPLDVNLTHAPLAREMATVADALDTPDVPVPVADGVVATTAESAPAGMAPVGELPGGVKLYRKVAGLFDKGLHLLPLASYIAAMMLFETREMLNAPVFGLWGLSAGILVMLFIRSLQAGGWRRLAIPQRRQITLPLVLMAFMFLTREVPYVFSALMAGMPGIFPAAGLFFMTALLVSFLIARGSADATAEPVIMLEPGVARGGIIWGAMAAWGSNILLYVSIGTSQFFHAIPEGYVRFPIPLILTTAGALIVTFFWRLPLSIVLITAGNIGNGLEGRLWGGVIDPMRIMSGNPNLADLLMWAGAGLLIHDAVSYSSARKAARGSSETAWAALRNLFLPRGRLSRIRWAWLAWPVLLLAFFVFAGSRGALPSVSSNLLPGEKTSWVAPAGIGRITGDAAADLRSIEHAVRQMIHRSPAAARTLEEYGGNARDTLDFLDEQGLFLRDIPNTAEDNARFSDTGGPISEYEGGNFEKTGYVFRRYLEIRRDLAAGRAGPAMIVRAADVLDTVPGLMGDVRAALEARWSADPLLRQADLIMVDPLVLSRLALTKSKSADAMWMRELADEAADHKQQKDADDLSGEWRRFAAQRKAMFTEEEMRRLDALAELVRNREPVQGNANMLEVGFVPVRPTAAMFAEAEAYFRVFDRIDKLSDAGEGRYALIFGGDPITDMSRLSVRVGGLRDAVAALRNYADFMAAPTPAKAMLFPADTTADATRERLEAHAKKLPGGAAAMWAAVDVNDLQVMANPAVGASPWLRQNALAELRKRGVKPIFEGAPAPKAPLTLGVTRRAAVWLARVLRLDPDSWFFRVLFPSVVESPIHYFKWFVRLHDRQSPEQITRGLKLINGTAARYFFRTSLWAAPITLIFAVGLAFLDPSLVASLWVAGSGILVMAFSFWLGGVRGHMRYLVWAYKTGNAPLTLGSDPAPVMQTPMVRRLSPVLGKWLEARRMTPEQQLRFWEEVRRHVGSDGKTVGVLMTPYEHVYLVDKMKYGVKLVRIGSRYDPQDDMIRYVKSRYYESSLGSPHYREVGGGGTVWSEADFTPEKSRLEFEANDFGEGTGLKYESYVALVDEDRAYIRLDHLLRVAPAGLRALLGEGGLAVPGYEWNGAPMVGAAQVPDIVEQIVGAVLAGGAPDRLLTVAEQQKILAREGLPFERDAHADMSAIQFALWIVARMGGEQMVITPTAFRTAAASIRSVEGLSEVLMRMALMPMPGGVGEALADGLSEAWEAMGRPVDPSWVDTLLDTLYDAAAAGYPWAARLETFAERVAAPAAALSMYRPLWAHVAPQYTSDGRYVVVKDRANLLVWDRRTGRMLHQIHAPWHADYHGYSLSPDGRTVALAGGDGLGIWDLASGELLHQASLPVRASVMEIVFSPDGRRLALKMLDRGLVLWDEERGAYLPARHEMDDELISFAWFPDGRRLLTTHTGGVSVVREVKGGGVPERLAHLGGAHLVFSPDGRRALIAGEDIRIRDVDGDGVMQLELPVASSRRFHLGFTPDGRYALMGGAGDVSHMWDTATGRHQPFPHAHDIFVFNSDGEMAATYSRHDGTLQIWGPKAEALLHTIAFPDGTVDGAVFNRDSSLLAVAVREGYASVVHLVDVRSGAVVRRLAPVSGANQEMLSFSPDSRYLSAGRTSGQVVVFDLRSATVRDQDGAAPEMRILSEGRLLVDRVSFSPDGRRLVAAGKELIVWDTDTWQVVRRHDHSFSNVRGFSFHPSLPLLCLSFERWDRVVIVNYETGESVRDLGDSKGVVRFSRGGEYALSGYAGVTEIRSANTGRLLGRYPASLFRLEHLVTATDEQIAAFIALSAPLTLGVTRRAAVWLARVLRLDPDAWFFRVLFPSVVESPIHYFKWFVRLHDRQSPEQITRGLKLINGTAARYFFRTLPWAAPITLIFAIGLAFLDPSLVASLWAAVSYILVMAFSFWLGGVRGHMRYLEFVEQTRAEKERAPLPIPARSGAAPLRSDDLRRMADILRSRLPYRLRIRVSDEVAYQAVAATLTDDMRRRFSDFARGRFDGTANEELLIMDEAAVVAGLSLSTAAELERLFLPWMSSRYGLSRDGFLDLLAQWRAGRPASLPWDGVVEEAVTAGLAPLARRAARQLVVPREVADATELAALAAEVQRALPADLQELLSPFPHRLALAVTAMAAPALYDDTLTLARMMTRPPATWDEVALRSLMGVPAGGGMSEADAERVVAHIRAVMLMAGYLSPQPERVAYADFTMQVGPEVQAPHIEPLITRLVEGDIHPEDFAAALELPGPFRDGRAALRRLAEVSEGRFADMARDGLRRLEHTMGRAAARLAFNPAIWAGLYGGMSADGRLVAHVDGPDTVRVWNTRTGEIVRSLRLEGTAAGAALVMSPDGRRVAVNLRGGDQLLVWDLATDRVIWRSFVKESRWGRFQGRFNLGGTRYVSAVGQHRVQMVNLETGAVLSSPVLSGRLNTALFARGDLAVYLGLENGSVVLWDFAAGTLREIVPERFQSSVGDIAEDADAGLLYVGTERSLEAWESDGGGVVRRSPERRVPVSAMYFDAGRGQIVVSSRVEFGEEWDAAEWEIRAEFVEPGNSRPSPDGRWVLVPRQRPGVVGMFRRADGMRVNTLTDGRFMSERPFSGDGTRMAFADDGDDPHLVRVLSSETGDEIARVGQGRGRPLAYQLSEDGSHLFVVDNDGVLRMWNVERGLPGPGVQMPTSVTAMDWNETPGLVAVGTSDGQIRVLRAGSLAAVAEHQFPDHNIPEGIDLGEFAWVRSIHPGHVISLAVRPDGGAVLFATRRDGIGEFNLGDRTVRMIFSDVDGEGVRVAYSREGYPLVEQSGVVRIFNRDHTPRHTVPADVFLLGLMRGKVLEPFLEAATVPGTLTNSLTYRFARWFLPLIGVAYTPRRAELWVAPWFELITLQSLLPVVFPLFLHDNRDALGRWSWGRALLRLAGHTVTLAVIALPFMVFPDAGFWMNLVTGIGLHVVVHHVVNRITGGASVRRTARALAAAVAARRGARPITAEMLVAAAPEAESLDVNAVAGGVAALQPALTAWDEITRDPAFAAEWRAALEGAGVAGVLDEREARRALQGALTAGSARKLDAAVLPGRERYFVTPGRDEARFRALTGTLAPGARAAFLVQPGDEAYYAALAAGNPAIRVVPALGSDERVGTLSLSALEARLAGRGMTLSNGLLVVPDNMAVSVVGLSDEVRRALVVLLVNDVLSAVALRTADLETVVRISRVMAVQA